MFYKVIVIQIKIKEIAVLGIFSWNKTCVNKCNETEESKNKLREINVLIPISTHFHQDNFP